MKMNINFINFCNQTIGAINKLSEKVESLKENYSQSSEEHYILDDIGDIISDEFTATDVGFSVLAAHLEDIANHALEIGDVKVIESLKRMGVLSEDDAKASGKE